MLNSAALSDSVCHSLMISAPIQTENPRLADIMSGTFFHRHKSWNRRSELAVKDSDHEHEELSNLELCSHHTVIHVEIEGEGNLRVWAIEE